MAAACSVCFRCYVFRHGDVRLRTFQILFFGVDTVCFFPELLTVSGLFSISTRRYRIITYTERTRPITKVVSLCRVVFGWARYHVLCKVTVLFFHCCVAQSETSLQHIRSSTQLM